MLHRMTPPSGFRGIYREDDPARAMYYESAGIARIIPSAVAVPADATDVVTLASGREERNSRWLNSRRRYNAGYGVKSRADMETLIRVATPGNTAVTVREALDEAWRLQDRERARAQRIARSGPSKLARNPSPAVSTSRPR